MTKSASAGVFAGSSPSSSWRRGCLPKPRPTPRKGVPGTSPQPPKLRRRAPKIRRWEAGWRGIVKCASKRNFPRTEGGQPPIPAPKTRERVPSLSPECPVGFRTHLQARGLETQVQKVSPLTESSTKGVPWVAPLLSPRIRASGCSPEREPPY